jgi:hypothetical protein
MKLIEPKQKQEQQDSLGKAIDQIKRRLDIGQTDEHTEEAVVARFLRGLDNRFTMLHKVRLGERGEFFPAILVGPAGLYMLNISHAKGFFRAKDDAWFEMNKSTQKFNPARPNLIKQSKEYAQKLGQVLAEKEKSHPQIQPVLIFASPGVNIESSNPAIRIVLMDGVDSLIDSMFNAQEVLQDTEVTYLADTLEIMADPEKAIPLGEGEDFFGRDLIIPEKKAPLTLPDVPLPNELPLQPLYERLGFSKKEWFILAGMLVLTIILLLGAILFALRII